MNSSPLLTDDYEPWEITDTGDLAVVQGKDLIKQRIQRLLFTMKGDIFHRENLGADLQFFRNKAPNDINIRRLKNRVESLLTTMPGVSAFIVDAHYKNNQFSVEIKVKIDDEWVEVQGVDI